MKKWTLSIISGVLVIVIGGVLLHFMTKETTDPVKNGNANDKPKYKIYYQEIQNIEFQTEIKFYPNGEKRPTTIYGYIDLDEGKHNRQNADILIYTTFFEEKGGYFMRSLNSNIKKSIAGKCNYFDIIQNTDGSENIRFLENVTYCVKTNQGRIASISINNILTSWSKYARIDVRLTIKSFDEVGN